VIKGALGNPRAPGYRLDAGGAVALGEKQLDGDVEDAFTKKGGRPARRATAAAARSRRRPFVAQRP
jgi:hypothetical protein